MRKLFVLLYASLCISILWSANALAGDTFSLDVGADYASRYIWRGLDLIPNNQPAVQPWFNLGYAMNDKLKVNYLLWADYRLVSGGEAADRDGETDNDWDEFDHCFFMTYDMNERVSLELGYIWYYLPSINDAHEVYGGVNVSINEYLSTSLYAYYNVETDDNDLYYIKVALDGTLPLSDHAELFGKIGLGYMDAASGFKGGLSDMPLSVGISTDLGRGLSMYVSGNYSVTLDSLRDNDLNHNNEAWVMTGLSFSM